MDEDQTMEKKQAVLNTYQKILDFIPGLKEQIKWTQRDHPSGLADIAELIRPVCLISLCVISYSTSHQLVQAGSCRERSSRHLKFQLSREQVLVNLP